MRDDQYSVVLFYTSNHAFRAEKILKARGVIVKLVPVPRRFSSECGVCLRIDPITQDIVLEALQVAQVEFDRIEQL